MPEPFATAQPGILPLPDAGTSRVRAGGEWTETLPGFREIVLLDDVRTGLRTVLMKMAPSSYAASHSHDRPEQIYVIEGEFYDDDTQYGAGDYLVRPAGTPHIAGSREGATVLVIYGAVEDPR